MTEKIRVDASDLTLGEMADVAEAAGEAEDAGSNFRYTAALAWVTKRRTAPTFTYADALALKMADLEIVDQAPEAHAAVNGGAPAKSPERGISIPAT